MSISSISSAAAGASYTAMSDDSSQVTQLEKEKQNLQKELQKVNQSQDDAKTKQDKVKQLQLQIQQIDQQIQQLKSEKSGQSRNTAQQTPKPAPPPDNAVQQQAATAKLYDKNGVAVADASEEEAAVNIDILA